jgi:5-oxoprolinase (ATP-hydrolysing) subunit A
MRKVDLNCDMGEGCGNDAELMRYVSSVNIACGYHAGDPKTMSDTVRLSLLNRVSIGAHPGYRDEQDFGRRPRAVPPEEAFKIVRDQVASLLQVCKELGATLHHVKPHGALYNQAAKDRALAAAIAEAVASIDRDLILYGLSGSHLISAARSAGLETASEVFADRTYRSDGSLTPRTDSHALITDADYSVRQVFEMVAAGHVTAVTGESVPIQADTVCIHGDGESAVLLARSIVEALTSRGVQIESP